MIVAACASIFTFNSIRDSIIGGLTTQETIIDIVYEAWPAYMIFLLVDGLEEQGGAVLTALHRMGIGSISTFIAFFIIGLPASVYLGVFKSYEISGIWIGAILANLF